MAGRDTRAEIKGEETMSATTWNPPMSQFDHNYAYLARHECEYLTRLAKRKPKVFLWYANLILTDGRGWDRTVDVGRVKEHVTKLLAK